MGRIIFILLLLIFISGCAERLDNSIEEKSPEIIPEEIETQPPTVPEEEPVEEKEEVIETTPEQTSEIPPAQEEPEIETELELIYPKLTYPDAYNGPLYATSEQVGNTAPTKQ